MTIKSEVDATPHLQSKQNDLKIKHSEQGRGLWVLTMVMTPKGSILQRDRKITRHEQLSVARLF